MIKPHGGVLINRVLGSKDSRAARYSKLPRISVTDDFILDAEKIAIGAYSPLKGFMCRDDFSSVVENMRLSNGVVWTIPIFLPVDRVTAALLSKDSEIVISDKYNNNIALLRVKDIFSFPKNRWAKKVYATESRKHPGVDKVYSTHDKLIGGDIYLINRPHFKFEEYNLDPVETRRMIKERGWRTVAGFQTRNVPHRAHEYLQKIALSITDGILIHPIIGWKKDGDFKPEAIIRAYKTLIKFYFPKDRVIFAGLATAMRYAGPREAVFHAIIRKNYGCTHFIVGRDHAGVGDYYAKYGAHEIFEKLPDLGIIPLLLREPYYCHKCGEMVSDKICPHDKRFHTYISGTMVRDSVRLKQDIPDYVIRKEVFEILKKKNMESFI